MKPMLAKNAEAARVAECLNDPQWFFQQKLDGDRLMVHVNDGAVSALNRNGEFRRNSVPRFVLDQFRGLSGEWFFDGELLGETFWVFDMPRAGTVVGPDNTFEFRLDMLDVVMNRAQMDRRWVRLLPTARTVGDKMRLVRQVVAQGGEGAILKHRSSTYRPGCRSDQMLKFKQWNTVDVVISAVRVNGHNNCEYAALDGDRWVMVGSCSLEGKPAVKIGDVVEVKYLYASEDRKLYQPSLLRIRDDKPAEQCTIDQLIFTDRKVVEFVPKKVGPFLRQRRRARATGATISVYDGHHPDSAFSRDDYRWVTFCEDHELLCTYETLAGARNFAVTPHTWCEECSEIWKERQSS